MGFLRHSAERGPKTGERLLIPSSTGKSCAQGHGHTGAVPGSCRREEGLLSPTQYMQRCCGNDPLGALSSSQPPCLCGSLLGLAKHFFFFLREKRIQHSLPMPGSSFSYLLCQTGLLAWATDCAAKKHRLLPSSQGPSALLGKPSPLNQGSPCS